MRITRGALSFTWEPNTDEGLPVTLTDDDTGQTVEFLLGDWAPWAGQSRPRVLQLTFTDPSGRKVRIPYERYVEFIADSFGELMALGGEAQYREARTRRRRTVLTDEFLTDVADIYRSAPDGTRIAAVRAKHPASQSQVYRWLNEARARGILPGREGE